ncbi:hypothetical protein TNCV_3956741 [Trichonephila clavipes]|nr:hypothetical protein TNCV_3956741 [Trichonephila clavipes]
MPLKTRLIEGLMPTARVGMELEEGVPAQGLCTVNMAWLKNPPIGTVWKFGKDDANPGIVLTTLDRGSKLQDSLVA